MTEFLAANLKARREAAGLSCRALDRAAAVAISTTRNIESGKNANPGDQTIWNLSQALGCAPEDLTDTTGSDPAPESVPSEASAREGAFQLLPFKALTPSPLNPRKTFEEEEIAELADSIRERGVLQNLVAEPADGAGMHRIVAGERRYRAIARLVAAGDWDENAAIIPVRIETGAESELRVLALLENTQRKDLPPLEEARAYADLMALDPDRWTTSALAKGVAKTQRYVQKRLRLLELSPKVQAALAAGQIRTEQAQALSIAAPDEQDRILKQTLGGTRWAQRAEDIRREAAGKRVPVERAIFPIDAWPGALVEDDAGNRYFADTESFMTRQRATAEAEAKRLGKEWAWAEFQEGYFWPGDYGHSLDTGEAGCVVQFQPFDGEVTIHTGLVRKSDEEEDGAPAETEAEREAALAAHRAEVAENEARREAFQRSLGDAIARLGAAGDEGLRMLARLLVYSQLTDNALFGDDEYWNQGERAEAWAPMFAAVSDPDEAPAIRNETWDDRALWTTLMALDDNGVTRLLADLLADTAQRPWQFRVSTGMAALMETLGAALPDGIEPYAGEPAGPDAAEASAEPEEPEEAVA